MLLDPSAKEPDHEELPALCFFALLLTTLAIAGLCYAVSAASDPIFERAEVYFAETAREMLASVRYVTPLYLGRPFFDKPILTYWAVLASFRAFGATHLAARVPSIIAALATIALTAYATSRLSGRVAGLMAAAVLASSYLFGYFAMLCMSDMLLTLFMTAASFLLLAGAIDAPRRGLLWWCASVCLALAVLTKGPVGAILPVAALLAYLAFTGGLRLIRLRHVLLALVTVCVLAGAWFFALWRDNGPHALYVFFIVENVKRFTGAAYPRQQQFGYIPVTLFVDALPWSLLLPAIAWNRIRGWRTPLSALGGRYALFLWCWLAVVTGFFWLSRMQLDYYVLPALPAYAALTGMFLARQTPSAERGMRVTAWVMAVMLFSVGVMAVCDFPTLLGAERSSLNSWLLPAWLCVGGAAMLILLWRRNYLLAYAIVFLAVCGTVPLGARALQPVYRRFLIVPTYARAIRQSGSTTALALSADLNAWTSEFAFQTGRVPQVLHTGTDLAAFLRVPGPRMVVVTEPWLAAAPFDTKTGLQVVQRQTGWTGKVELETILAPPNGPAAALRPILLATSNGSTGGKTDPPPPPRS